MNESTRVRLAPEAAPYVRSQGPSPEGLKWVILNRPDKSNALNEAVTEELLHSVRTAYRDGTRVLAIRANGKNFCSGFDLAGVEDADEAHLLYRLVRIEQALQALRNAPFVTVACAHGAAFGAGADLVAACDYRVGVRGCRFRFPGFQFGIALGTRQLVRLIGRDRARDILLRNAVVPHAEAEQWGLLNRSVETIEECESVVLGIARDSGGLTAEALAQLLSIVREDSSDRDMADLVSSSSREGLIDRIKSYKRDSKVRKT
jgi:methylglutaconyl-CoA hydratase